MPVYRKGKGRYLVVVCYRGRRQDWIVKGTRADAEAFEARERTKAEQGDPGGAPRVVPTFCAFCVEKYRPHARLHLKASTWRNRIYTLANLVEHFGHLRLTEINCEHIEAYLVARVGAKVKPSTINDDLKVLRKVLSYARDLGIPTAIPKAVPLVVRGRRNVRAWTTEEVGKLYAACAEKSPAVLPLVVFLANTGSRRGEAIALTWEHVDLDRRMIRYWPSEEWQPKNGEPREVPINDALLPWLDGARRSEKWVFPSQRRVDGKLQPFAFWPQRAFDRARKHAKLTGGPHTLRHTFATHFLSTTPDLYLLARILGHGYARVTELYSHLLPDHLERARKAVSLPSTFTPAALETAARWARRSKSIKAGKASGVARGAKCAHDATDNVVKLERPAQVGTSTGNGQSLSAALSAD